MKKTNKFIYNTIFWISRACSVLFLGFSLFTILNLKYILLEKYFHLLFIPFHSSFAYISNKVNLFNIWVHNIINVPVDIRNLGPINEYESVIAFCKNSQIIDLLLIALAVILIISIPTIKSINNKHKYLLTTSVISSVVYIAMYLIFSQPIMIALAIATPIIYILIQLSNKICPIQKLIMLIPIIGEILCTKNIIKHIFKNSSDKFKQISLLIVALIVSNIVCFLFSYKTDKDFENRILDNWTYSIRPYQDRLIISAVDKLIILDKNKTITYIKNDRFAVLEDFIIDNYQKNLYFLDFVYNTLSILAIDDFNFKNGIFLDKKVVHTARLNCNSNFSKLIVINDENNIGTLINLNTHEVKYIRNIAFPRDKLIYNKYRSCFLISFYEDNSFLEEIDIENKKIRKIKADKDQGYLAISERNKEIYVAFHQQGRIGVYDAETMKLKRKIKTNYTVKDITYDEELNILIAPSYFTGYVDIFLMDGSDKLLTRAFVGYELREGCFDPQKENLYICSATGLYKKQIDIKKLIEQNSNVSHETKN